MFTSNPTIFLYSGKVEGKEEEKGESAMLFKQTIISPAWCCGFLSLRSLLQFFC